MLNNESQARTEVDSSTTADVTTSSHSIGNTNVVRSWFCYSRGPTDFEYIVGQYRVPEDESQRSDVKYAR